MLEFDVKNISQAEEASRARSGGEFISEIEQCAQEAGESQLWLELLQDDCDVPADRVRPIWRQADELIAIFVTMSVNTKTRLQRET
jgi:four helix bundle protein